MKNLIFRSVVFLCFSWLMNTCASESTDDTAVLYQCPMKCEGEKTYNKPYMKSIQVRIDSVLNQRLSLFAKRNYMGKSDVISRALVALIDGRKETI